jgi:hypothetical protein
VPELLLPPPDEDDEEGAGELEELDPRSTADPVPPPEPEPAR